MAGVTTTKDHNPKNPRHSSKQEETEKEWELSKVFFCRTVSQTIRKQVKSKPILFVIVWTYRSAAPVRSGDGAARERRTRGGSVGLARAWDGGLTVGAIGALRGRRGATPGGGTRVGR